MRSHGPLRRALHFIERASAPVLVFATCSLLLSACDAASRREATPTSPLASAPWGGRESPPKETAPPSQNAEADGQPGRGGSMQAAVSAPPTCPDGMVGLSGGTFSMGSSDGKRDERPVTSVTVAPFCIDATEVTTVAYTACVKAGGCTKPGTQPGCNYGHTDRALHPINCVDAAEAEAFCRAAAPKKRLPTEQEWEFAARGVEGRVYPWGSEAPSDHACWNRKDGTCPAGRAPQGNTPQGVSDLAGNVWEWTSSGYSAGYDQARESGRRVLRGGAWNNNFSGMLRGAGRSWNVPTAKLPGLGFRCAK